MNNNEETCNNILNNLKDKISAKIKNRYKSDKPVMPAESDEPFMPTEIEFENINLLNFDINVKIDLNLLRKIFYDLIDAQESSYNYEQLLLNSDSDSDSHSHSDSDSHSHSDSEENPCINIEKDYVIDQKNPKMKKLLRVTGGELSLYTEIVLNHTQILNSETTIDGVKLSRENGLNYLKNVLFPKLYNVITSTYLKEENQDCRKKNIGLITILLMLSEPDIASLALSEIANIFYISEGRGILGDAGYPAANFILLKDNIQKDTYQAVLTFINDNISQISNFWGMNKDEFEKKYLKNTINIDITNDNIIITKIVMYCIVVSYNDNNRDLLGLIISTTTVNLKNNTYIVHLELRWTPSKQLILNIQKDLNFQLIEHQQAKKEDMVKFTKSLKDTYNCILQPYTNEISMSQQNKPKVMEELNLINAWAAISTNNKLDNKYKKKSDDNKLKLQKIAEILEEETTKTFNKEIYFIPDGQFNDLINALKINEINVDQNVIERHKKERSQFKSANRFKWRPWGGRKTRKGNKGRKGRKTRK